VNRDEIRRAMQEQLKWVVVGPASEPRSEADMRAIVEWIDRAVDSWLLDPNSFEGRMLDALLEGILSVAAVRDGELRFQLTEKGRAYVDSMPHDPRRLSTNGIGPGEK